MNRSSSSSSVGETSIAPQSEALFVGGPKDGQWMAFPVDSTGDRVFIPILEQSAAELMYGAMPLRVSQIAYHKIKLQLLTSHGRSEFAYILHNEGNGNGRFDATEFLRKLLESYGEPKPRWRKPTPEDGGFDRYYYVMDQEDDYTTTCWNQPINIHSGNDGRFWTYIPRRNQPIRQHYFSENVMVCECVCPPKEDQKESKE